MERKQDIVLTVLLCPALVFAYIEPLEKWSVKDYWGRIEPKMTQEVVLELIGEPKDREVTTTAEIWYYQDTPQRAGDRIIGRPKHGFVRFRKNDVACLLFNWEEPDWTVTAPRSEMQYLSSIRTIEAQKQAEELNRQREEQRLARIAEAERTAQEQQERLAAEAEIRKARIEQDTQQNHVVTSPSESNKRADGYTLNNVHTKYWFMVGGAFILMAVIISVTYGVKR